MSTVPPSLSWDESAIGYNAYSILKTGRDEWGNFLPFFFKSFGEYKHPFHIYFATISEAVFGVNEFSVRFGSAFFGVVNVTLLFFLSFLIFKDERISLLSSFFLAISPWHIQFSRVAWETNFTLFFFFVALIFFLKWVNTEKLKFLVLSLLFFGLDMFTYNPPKVFIPLVMLFLPVFYWRELSRRSVYLFIYILISFLFAFVLYFVFYYFSSSRYLQLTQDLSVVVSTASYRLTHIYKLGWLELMLRQYLSHFSFPFLFSGGDPNPRHSVQTFGELFIYDVVFLPFGFFALLKSKSKFKYILIIWFLLWPVPASVVREYPHASRAAFGLGILQLVSALGVYHLFNIFESDFIKKFLFLFFGFVILITLRNYVYQYFFVYPMEYSQAWQYGYKELAMFIKDDYYSYDKIYVTREYGEPQIFLLFYMEYPPERYQNDSNLVRRKEGDWEVVRGFDKFFFFDRGHLKETLERSSDRKDKNVLVVVGNEDLPSGSIIKKTINFLDGSKAFEIAVLGR